MNELKLWEGIQNGDAKALKSLHAEYFYAMCLFARKSVKDDDAVEQIVSDCFLNLWNNSKTIQISSSLKSYLYRMLRNRIIDYYRQKDEDAELLNEYPEIAEEQEFDAQQRYAKLYATMELLPQQRRQILELAVFDSLTYQEIADKLQISKNTVKTQIARAYRFLKEKLEPQDFYLLCIFFGSKQIECV